ncbi:oligosaccharide flippase family protein [Algibacter aquimarinus]|uniref:Polysaccharide biosynthesis protein C-terminal domain-containing protein n=1 Tax=Algibacter aquimarinus TaxID=1136748 RepID=A0ABP9HCM9_9FLAO
MKKLSHNIIFNLAGNAFVILYSVLLLPAVLSTLGAEAAGVIGLYNTLFAALAFFDLGFGLLANREISKNIVKNKFDKNILNLISTLEILYWIISFIILLIIYFAAPYISENILSAETFSDKELIFFIRLIAVSMFFRWPISFYFNINSGLQNLVGVNIIKMIVYLILMLSLYYLIIVMAFDIGEYLIVIAFTNFLLVASYFYFSKKKLGFKNTLIFKYNTLKGHFTYALGSMVISTLTLLFIQLDKIYLTKLGNLSDLGIYTVLFSLSIGIVQIVYPVTYAFFPKINELIVAQKRDELLEKVKTISSILILISFCFLVLFFSFREEILSLWIGELNSEDTQNLFLILVLAGCIYATAQIPYLIESALGKVKFVMKYFIFSNILYLGCLYVFSNMLELKGVAISYLLAICLYFVGAIYLFNKNLGIKFTLNWLKNIMVNILISSILIIIIRLIKLKIIDGFLAIAIEIGLSMIIVILILVLFNSNLRLSIAKKSIEIIKYASIKQKK